MKHFLKIALLIGYTLSLLSPISASAVISKDAKSVFYDSVWWDATDGGCDPENGGGGGTSPVTGNGNVENIFNFLYPKVGRTRAAAIIGNLMQESGQTVNPRAVQQGGAGRGIAQWSEGGRWNTLQKWAAGRDIWALETQRDFMWHELSTGYKHVLDEMMATNDLIQLVTIFCRKYEIAGIEAIDNRVRGAQSVLNSPFSQGKPENPDGSATPPGASTPESCETGGGIGVDGNFAFPQKTTQAAAKKGGWCWQSQTSCHHDYKAADIMTPQGTVNIAAVAGTVIQVTDFSHQCMAGSFDVPRTEIKGDDGKYYYYTHMKPGSMKVSRGQHVTMGQELGVVGPKECGQGTEHLHFQMSNGPIENTNDPAEHAEYIDPQPFLIAAFKKLPEN